MKAFITALTLTLTACSVYAKEYHVSTTGFDGNAGSQSKPLNTISAAAQIAQPGDVITVHEGVNSEPVDCGLFPLVDEIKYIVDCWRV